MWPLLWLVVGSGVLYADVYHGAGGHPPIRHGVCVYSVSQYWRFRRTKALLAALGAFGAVAVAFATRCRI
jgi:hypothetical protein